MARRRDTRVSPFVQKLHQMVTSSQTDHAISWTSEHTFTVNKKRIETVLPHYFRHSNFSSFVRQLASYGFQRTQNDSLQCQFSHKSFSKDSTNNHHEIRSTANPSRTAEARQKQTEIEHLQRNVEEMVEINDNIERLQSSMLHTFAAFIFQNKDTLEETSSTQEPEAYELHDLRAKRKRNNISQSVYDKLSPIGDSENDTIFGAIISKIKHLVIHECPVREAMRRRREKQQREEGEQKRALEQQNSPPSTARTCLPVSPCEISPTCPIPVPARVVGQVLAHGRAPNGLNELVLEEHQYYGEVSPDFSACSSPPSSSSETFSPPTSSSEFGSSPPPFVQTSDEDAEPPYCPVIVHPGELPVRTKKAKTENTANSLDVMTKTLWNDIARTDPVLGFSNNGKIPAWLLHA